MESPSPPTVEDALEFEQSEDFSNIRIPADSGYPTLEHAPRGRNIRVEREKPNAGQSNAGRPPSKPDSISLDTWNSMPIAEKRRRAKDEKEKKGGAKRGRPTAAESLSRREAPKGFAPLWGFLSRSSRTTSTNSPDAEGPTLVGATNQAEVSC